MSSFTICSPRPVASPELAGTAPAGERATSRFTPPPELKSPPQSAATALTVAPPPQRGWLASWFAPRPPQVADPAQRDVNRAWQHANVMPQEIHKLHGILANNTRLLATAPNGWEELLTPYVVVRASAIAALASAKVHLDGAFDAGVQAALALPSRKTYDRAVAHIRAADAECEALIPTMQERYGEAKAIADKATREQEEAQAAQREMRESAKDLSPEKRQSLVARITQLAAVDYLFASAAYGDTERSGVDMRAIPPDGVIPTLVLQGEIVFGRRLNQYEAVALNGSRTITSLAELIDLVDSMMGRGGSGA